MLAAVTGLAYTVGNLLRLEGYMAYVLPLPVVVASLRSGAAAGVKTLTCAVLLLLSESRAWGGDQRGVGAAGRRRWRDVPDARMA